MMDWQERTERQIGARGIRELREWMAPSAPSGTAALPARLLSLLVVLLAVVLGLLIGPTSSPAAADPLPPGTYRVTVAGGLVVIEVDDDGRAELTVEDGLVVQLAFDDDGRVLDEFLVLTTDDAVSIELRADTGRGSYGVVTSPGPETGHAAGGATPHASLPPARRDAVRTVSACPPSAASDVVRPNHGTAVSAAASGIPLEVEVATGAARTVRTVRVDLSTLDGAEAFCDLVAPQETQDHPVEERPRRAPRDVTQGDPPGPGGDTARPQPEGEGPPGRAGPPRSESPQPARPGAQPPRSTPSGDTPAPRTDPGRPAAPGPAEPPLDDGGAGPTDRAGPSSGSHRAPGNGTSNGPRD